MLNLPPIYFYIPDRYFPRELPASAEENWPGFGLGIYAWTLQTYLRLQDEGFPCQLVRQLPGSGIVLIHQNALRAHKTPIKPGQNLLLICIKAEGRRHPYAQLHVVQNPVEAQMRNSHYFLPHWPQPGLIPRDPQRSDRFENIAFFGHVDQLAPELQAPSFARTLESMGLRWHPLTNCNAWNDYSQVDNRWNDYSQVDAILAVRSFDPRRTYLNKPATKLYNAWLAGVPAVLGAESAYQTAGNKGKNYWEVNSLPELISALERLKHDLNFRQALVQNGKIAARAIAPTCILARWRNFLEQIAIPTYDRWNKMVRPWQQIRLETDRCLRNLERIRSYLTRSTL